MDLDINLVGVTNTDYSGNWGFDPSPFNNRPMAISWIALGDAGAKRLNESGINYFKLPHPSKLPEDKQQISRLLYRCKKFIYE